MNLSRVLVQRIVQFVLLWTLSVGVYVMADEKVAASKPLASLKLLFHVRVQPTTEIDEQDRKGIFFVNTRHEVFLDDWELLNRISVFSDSGTYLRSLPFSSTGVENIVNTNGLIYAYAGDGFTLYGEEGRVADSSQENLFLYPPYVNRDLTALTVSPDGTVYLYSRPLQEDFGMILRVEPRTDTITELFSFRGSFEDEPFLNDLRCDARGNLVIWVREPILGGANIRFVLTPKGRVVEKTVYPDLIGDYIGTTHDGSLVTRLDELDQPYVLYVHNPRTGENQGIDLLQYYRSIGLEKPPRRERFFQSEEGVIYVRVVGEKEQFVSVLHTQTSGSDPR